MKKILIVEDEKILGEMYVKIFSEAGLKAILAKSAETGLRMAKKEKPDLILLDILLPKKSGNYLLSKLRANPKISSINVVAFSNFDDPQAKKEAVKLGVLDYLIKTDYTPERIVAKVKNYLQNL